MRGPEAGGLYTAGYRLIESLMFLSSSFYIVVFPILSRLYAHGGEERLRYAYTQSIKFISLLLFPVSAGVAALAVPILRLVYGEEFVPGAPALAVVGCVVGLQGLSVVMGRLLIVVHRLGAIIRVSLITVVVNVGLNLLLIPRLGIVGVAIAGVASEAVVVLLNWVALGGAVKRPNLIADLWRIALAAFGMGLVVWWAREMPLVVTVPMGVAVYAVFLFALGGLTKEDRGVLMRIVKRS
jgi:O-antigen/teichoic acid export membrane protein